MSLPRTRGTRKSTRRESSTSSRSTIAPQEEVFTNEMASTTSLESLQSDEQSRVLDTVQQLRKCGLEGFLPLPQLVVCGDQSAGKSSVLEALTEIPFPRNDNLCTRFATEINLRRAPKDSLTLKLLPDAKRPEAEKKRISTFRESITNFNELPKIMEKATAVMGIAGLGSSKAFAKDVLSIEIEGPSRPQLSLVDLPGLIQNASKGVTTEDVETARGITDAYISQSRTICLAVISATNDYANQGILSKVRKVDKEGERTLGIITKPDRLPSGSGSEASFLELAGNNDIFFKLGWHVLKNRKFEERDYSFKERNASETAYFATSNFKCLPKDAVGINSLRIRLSQLLFSHVKQELPKLQAELEGALADTKARLDVLGTSRATPEECRSFLTELSQVCHTICKAAADGHYEGQYFVFKSDESFTSTNLEPPIRRLRARIQKLNEDFVANFRQNAHTYSITNPTTKAGYAEIQDSTCDTPSSGNKNGNKALSAPAKSPLAPEALTREKALQWVRKALTNNRGRELSGNFNPLVVGELFWDQSKKWELFVEEHIENVAATCTKFLKDLFKKKYPQDVRDRVWREQMQEVLNDREANARHELGKIMKDNKKHPINYNSYYTETVTRDRQKRKYDEMTSTLNDSPAMLDKSYTSLDGGQVMAPRLIPGAANIELAMEKFKNAAFSEGKVDIDRHACEEALDCLVAIYQVNLETFIANVAVQIVERHIVCDIEEIFCPVEVNKLSDKKIMDIAEEPAASRRQRAFLKDRIAKLEEGRKILRRAMSGTI